MNAQRTVENKEDGVCSLRAVQLLCDVTLRVAEDFGTQLHVARLVHAMLEQN
jgi:hypothetical protein